MRVRSKRYQALARKRRERCLAAERTRRHGELELSRLWLARCGEETLHLLKTLHPLRGLLIFMRETGRDAYEADGDAGIRRARVFSVDLLYFALVGQDVRRYPGEYQHRPNPFEIWLVVRLVRRAKPANCDEDE